MAAETRISGTILMKVSLDSLNKYLSKKLTIGELTETLLKTEIEVEQVMSSNNFDKKIVIGQIKNITKHPNTDKLFLVKVDIAKDSLIDIICGAPNIKVGQKVPTALINAKLPDGLVIKKAEIRGKVSNGMLCSAQELKISDDHSGILILENNLPIGKKLSEIWPKSNQLDIKTPPNRWDYLSLIGLAREISVFSVKNDNKLRMPKINGLEYSQSENIKIRDKKLCPRFLSAKFKVNNKKQSPTWLVNYLESNDLRSINPVVDITNFVMLELGQPSHAYDIRKLEGKVGVRLAKKKEKFISLEGEKINLTKNDLVVVDKTTSVSLAGVIGSQKAEVDENTEEILLEVANFDKTHIRKSALRHGIRTESSTRFERSLPLALGPIAFERTTAHLKEICDGQIIDGPYNQLYAWPWVQHIGLSIRKAEKILGITLNEKEVIKGLQKLGFEVEHFSILKEARKHLGKPYKMGASFKTDGVEAFDCSYLIDYIYSLIGVMVGHTASQQYNFGKTVRLSNLKPGDILFRDGPWVEFKREDRQGVSHNAMYIGDGKIIHAMGYARNQKGKWEELPLKEQKVVVEPVEVMSKDPMFLGAKRMVDNLDDFITITVPWWRSDVKIPEDIIEEIIKLTDYDKLPDSLPQIDATDNSKSQTLLKIVELKKILAASGLTEVLTYSLVGKELIEKIGLKEKDHLELANPLTHEQQYLRTTLMASLINVAANNQDYDKKFAFFEISKLHLRSKQKNQQPDEHWAAGIVTYGKDSLLRLKGLIDYIADFYKLEFTAKPSQIGKSLIKSHSAKINLGDKKIGYFGQVDFATLNKFNLNDELSYGEIYLEPILNQETDIKAKQLPSYQMVKRDISIEVSINISWQQISEIIRSIDKISRYQFLNDYQDEQMIKEAKKALLFRIELNLGAKPTSAQIENTLNQVTAKLKSHLGEVKFR
ncbi:MAG: phenylalanine--tRNA ligase subunit beta [bacterium]|nr:phenylalanine--tRNA ligase subunit beta [bacterium]